MLGSYYRTWDGKQCDFIGAIDYYTVGSKERMIGNFLFECLPESGGSTVVGFENHSGKTYLGSGVSPLGKVLVGGGNNGEDGCEGVRYRNVFGTYSHGPVLPKTPRFATICSRRRCSSAIRSWNSSRWTMRPSSPRTTPCATGC